MNDDRSDEVLLGKKIVETAIKMDESLADLLKIEIKRLRQIPTTTGDYEEMHHIMKLVRSIIIAITLTDEKIRNGLDLYRNSNRPQEHMETGGE